MDLWSKYASPGTEYKSHKNPRCCLQLAEFSISVSTAVISILKTYDSLINTGSPQLSSDNLISKENSRAAQSSICSKSRWMNIRSNPRGKSGHVGPLRTLNVQMTRAISNANEAVNNLLSASTSKSVVWLTLTLSTSKTPRLFAVVSNVQLRKKHSLATCLLTATGSHAVHHIVFKRQLRLT